MKEFFKIMGTYFAPYKKYITFTLLLNIFAAIMNVFSFTMLLPILRILFNVNQEHYEFMPWQMEHIDKILLNNFYYFSQSMVEQFSPATALLLFGGALSCLTLLKTAADFEVQPPSCQSVRV